MTEPAWTERVQGVLLSGMFLLGAVALPHAPARVAIHWDLAGHPNGYADPLTGLFLDPLLTLGLYLVLRLAPRRDPYRGLATQGRGAYAVLRLGTTALLAVGQYVIVTTALGRHPDVALLSALSLGLFLLLLGAVLRRLPPNGIAGVRTPWTGRSERVWVKTQQQASRLCTLVGLLIGTAGVARTPRDTVVLLVVALLLSGSVGLVAYSYLIWRWDPHAVSPSPPAAPRRERT